MKLRVARNLIVSAVAAGAVLAGAPAAMAATSSPTAPVVRVSPAAAWYFYSSYPTHLSCAQEGTYLQLTHAIGNYKCVEMNEGQFYVYYLYYQLGQGPGG